MPTLYLAEKPSQAKLIAQTLGATTFAARAWHSPDIVVIPARGHMLNLATADEYVGNGRWTLSDLPILPNQWIWNISDEPEVREQFAAIGEYLKHATNVVIATDPDEEGEVIGRAILLAHNYKGKVSRLWTSALDPNGLSNALSNLQPISATDSYYRAGMIRRELDWLFGMNFSRAYSVSTGRTVHIGRVKTRLLAELVNQEEVVSQYVPTKMPHTTSTIGGFSFDFTEEPPIDASHHGITQPTRAHVTDFNVLELLPPPQPYSLTSLLADAADSGVPIQAGYAAAQALYEQGSISYPRSNSRQLPGANHNSSFAAHSALIQTAPIQASATHEMNILYDLIGNNFSLNTGETSFSRVSLAIDIGGSTHVLQGEVPSDFHFDVGSDIELLNISTEFVDLKTPSRFTEARFLRWMEQNSLGTDATRVDAITSLERDKVATTIMGGQFIPTLLGKHLYRSLPSQLTGHNMNQITLESISAARRGVDMDRYVIEAMKFIIGSLPQRTVLSRST